MSAWLPFCALVRGPRRKQNKTKARRREEEEEEEEEDKEKDKVKSTRLRKTNAALTVATPHAGHQCKNPDGP